MKYVCTNVIVISNINKIEGTAILNLATVKRLKVKENLPKKKIEKK